MESNNRNNIFAVFSSHDESRNLQYKKEPVKGQGSSDRAVYARFAEMRKLSEKNTMNTDDIFILQGKFMETFTDHYDRTVMYDEYYPDYYSMSDAQLRTYFTWRTQVRNGELQGTSGSYIIVYICELINHIGVDAPDSVMEKLVWLLKDCPKLEKDVKQYLINCIKDYYICNNFDVSFQEIVKKNGLETYYPSAVHHGAENPYSYQTLFTIANYNIEESKFYTKENKALFISCFEKVLCYLNPLLSIYGADLDELILGPCDSPTWWAPFPDAIYKKTKSADRKVIIAKNEIYILRNGLWEVRGPAKYTAAAAPIVLGYIIKRIEANLRVLTNYRYKLTSKRDSLLEKIHPLYGISNSILSLINDPALDEIIDETTKLEFAALSSGEQHAKAPAISEKLSRQIGEEPYQSFVKMRNSDALRVEFDNVKKFQIQAKMLAHLTDDFETIVPLQSLMPLFDEMSNEQLRCYVTWRSKVRRGEYSVLADSYMHLYISELVNRVEEKEDDKIIEKLVYILRHESDISKRSANFVSTCIKDYYLCGNIADSFYEIIKKHGIAGYYPNVFIEFAEDLDLDIFKQLSNYNISKSRFYNAQTLPLLNDCFKYVFEDVKQYFSDQHIDLKQIIAGPSAAKLRWKPFNNVLCNNSPKADKRVVLCSNEIYVFKRFEWTCEAMPEKDKTGAILIGYMVKRMEARMREILKFRLKLSVDVSAIVKSMDNSGLRHVVENPVFDQTIDAAVWRYFFKKTVEANIDKSKLGKIREEADIIRDKLIIEEDIWETAAVPPPAAEPVTKTQRKSGSPMAQLCAELTEVQKEALNLILSESPGMPGVIALAQRNRMMPEVLLDGINELSLELISDNLIETAEEDPFIYDDYVKEIKECLEAD